MGPFLDQIEIIFCLTSSNKALSNIWPCVLGNKVSSNCCSCHKSKPNLQALSTAFKLACQGSFLCAIHNNNKLVIFNLKAPIVIQKTSDCWCPVPHHFKNYIIFSTLLRNLFCLFAWEREVLAIFIQFKPRLKQYQTCFDFKNWINPSQYQIQWYNHQDQSETSARPSHDLNIDLRARPNFIIIVVEW